MLQGYWCLMEINSAEWKNNFLRNLFSLKTTLESSRRSWRVSQSAFPLTCLCSTLPVSHAPLIRPTPYTCGSTCLSLTLATFKPAPVISSVPDCSSIMPLSSVHFGTDLLLPTSPVPDLPASSLPWILPQSSVSNHEFCLFPPGFLSALRLFPPLGDE